MNYEAHFDEYNYDPSDLDRSRKPRVLSETCVRCGYRELTSHHTGVRWAYLESDGRLHVCTVVQHVGFENLNEAKL